MSEFSEEYLLNRQEYGCLYPYLVRDEVSRIYWNGRSLWIEEEGKGRHTVGDRPDERFVERFAMLMGNRCGQAFNASHPVLEWSGEKLSVQLLHESATTHGSTILLKKKPVTTRLSAAEMVESGLCAQEAIPILKEIVRDGHSFLIVGTGGDARDILMLFMTRYFAPEERVVVLTDEHGPDPVLCNPDKDITDIRVSEGKPPGWLRRTLRVMEPAWILGMYPEGDTLCEMMYRAEADGAHTGAVVAAGGEPEDVVKALFPGETEANEKRLQDDLKQAFPVRLIADGKGLARILRYDRVKQPVWYERKTN